MRIAVINETSAADRNGDVVRALDGPATRSSTAA